MRRATSEEEDVVEVDLEAGEAAVGEGAVREASADEVLKTEEIPMRSSLETGEDQAHPQDKDPGHLCFLHVEDKIQTRKPGPGRDHLQHQPQEGEIQAENLWRKRSKRFLRSWRKG